MLRGKTKPCFSFHSTFIHILFETKRREKKVMKKKGKNMDADH